MKIIRTIIKPDSLLGLVKPSVRNGRTMCYYDIVQEEDMRLIQTWKELHDQEYLENQGWYIADPKILKERGWYVYIPDEDYFILCSWGTVFDTKVGIPPLGTEIMAID